MRHFYVLFYFLTWLADKLDVEQYKFYCYDSVGDVHSFDLNEVVRYFRMRDVYIYICDEVTLDHPRYMSFLGSDPSIKRIEIHLNDTQWSLANLFKNGICWLQSEII